MPPKKDSSSSSSAPAVSLSPEQTDLSWRVLGGLLKDSGERDDVKHAQVQQVAERLFNSSVLSGSPDVDALEVLSVSLVQQARWSSVVSLLTPHSATLVPKRPTLSFHLAYALYRDKHHAKCLDELKKRGAALSEGELHLQAQALYRAGQYAAAARVYRDTQLAEDDDVEMQANMIAALVSAGQLDEAKAYMKKLLVLSSPASFELAYNASCALIESGDYAGALATVRKAESMCNEVLRADGASDSEIEHELAGLRVQEAFILQQLSRLPGAQGTENEQALSLYTRVLGDKHTDPNVSSIASNNIITLRSGSSKIWDSLKKSNKAMDIDLKDMTLSVRQRSTIQLNRALVLLHGRQNDKCRELLAGLTKEFHSNAQIALAQAAVLAKDKTRVREAEEALRDWLRSNEPSAAPESVQSMYLGLAHLALLRSDIPAALSCLSTLVGKKGGAVLAHKPALVATLVALHERNNDVEAAHQTIQAAIQHWSAASSQKDPAAARLLQRLLSSAGAFYSRHGREQDAAALLEALAAETQSGSSAASRSESVARLVLAYAHAGNAAKEAQYVSQLPSLSIPAELDVSQLESVPAPEVAKRKPKKKLAAAASAASAKKPSAEGTDDDTDGGGDDTDGEEDGGDAKTDDAAPSASLAKAAARLRAKAAAKAAAAKKPRIPKRYPKGFDPANPGPMPDPERWLPRWERSNQKKYKRRQGNAIRGAQGSTNMANAAATSSAKEPDSVSVESKGQVSGAAAAAARKRAAKKARAAGAADK